MVLRNIRQRNTRCNILGYDSELPIFVSPAALAKLVHPDGEKGIATGCHSKGIIQCVGTLFSPIPFLTFQIKGVQEKTFPIMFVEPKQCPSKGRDPNQPILGLQ